MGGATFGFNLNVRRLCISIHAPRGGSDIPFLVASSRSWHFNPRSPWGERLLRLPIFLLNPSNFNPRSPWGERPTHLGVKHFRIDFNPRSPWGERPRKGTSRSVPVGISIHAPRGGSDAFRQGWQRPDCNFNPRSPRGERRVHLFWI